MSVRTIDVWPSEGAGYRVFVGKGALSDLGERVTEVAICRKAVIISDEHVGPAYGKLVKSRLDEAGYEVYDLLIPPGEESKAIDIASEIWLALAQYGFTRDDLVVAVGGGVVGDVAGFTASTFMRGIPVVQVPTSLLAMVDASIGGKTAIDLTCGKNLVGTFHQPLLVISDTRCLKTLHDEDWANGWAEVIKSAVVSPQRSFYEFVRGNAEALVAREDGPVEEAVWRAADLKASVVSQDANETGRRICLNYGHTLAHAIENAFGYGSIGHGRAVAEGMRFASRLAVEMLGADVSFVRKLDALLDAFGLEEQPFDLEPAQLLLIMHRDKKVRGDDVRFVLASDFTAWEVVDVPDEVLMQHLEAWCANKRRLGKM